MSPGPIRALVRLSPLSMYAAQTQVHGDEHVAKGLSCSELDLQAGGPPDSHHLTQSYSYQPDISQAGLIGDSPNDTVN